MEERGNRLTVPLGKEAVLAWRTPLKEKGDFARGVPNLYIYIYIYLCADSELEAGSSGRGGSAGGKSKEKPFKIDGPLRM